MKKLLVVLLTLALCVTSLASCDFLGNLFGGPQETPVEYNAEAAADYVYNLYQAKKKTPSSFDVTAIANILGAQHTVEWSVDTDKITITKKNDTTYTVNIPENVDEDIEYVLTATVKGGDQTATRTFNFVVPGYNLNTFEEYLNAEEGDLLTVRGVVAAINSKAAGNTRNHLFLADLDGKGGYYIYQMDTDPADTGIEVGMTVEVKGPAAPYSGMMEIKGGVATIVDSNKKEVAPLDITDKIAPDANLKAYVGLPVTIKGVEIKGQELEKETSQYLKFEINGVTSYIRTYVTDFPTTLKAEDKATIDAAHAAKFGYNANVTGILVLYNSAPYLIPMSVDCFEYLAAVEKTPEEKVDATLGELKLNAIYNKDTVVTLPATGTAYTDVALTWASNNAAAVVADGKLTITIPAEDVEVTITVTATCGEATKSKEIKVKLSNFPDANTYLDLVQANKIGVLMNGSYTEGKYFVTGEIVSIDPDKDDNTKLNKYGNMTIKDKDGNTFYLYGLYSADGAVRFDKMNPQPKVGDTITVYGIIGSYKGAAQMKNGWLVTVPAADSELSIPAANTIGLAQGHDKYTEGKYSITGEITEIASTKYGNMTIKDEKGNTLYLYGLYSADGATRYDGMEVKPAVGDTITVYGIVGQYKGTAQVKNGWMTKHTVATTPDQGGNEGGETTVPAGATAASKKIADLITELKWTNSTTKQEFKLDDKVTVKINGGNNTGKAYDGDHIRIYATDTPAGTITITLAEGYELVSIKVSAVTGTYAFLCVDGTTTDICNTSVTVSGSSVVLNSVRNGDDGKQIRVTAIEVVYKPVG